MKGTLATTMARSLHVIKEQVEGTGPSTT